MDAGESSSRWSGVIVQKARSFLEVGCGPGFVLAGLREVLPQARLVASEIYSARPALCGRGACRRRLNSSRPIAWRCRTISEFDAVGAFDVIEHIDREADAIAEMRRALKPGGVIFLTVPQHPWLWSRVDEIDDHKRRYRRGELSARLRDSGFSVLCDTSFMFFLLPAMMAQRLVANRGSTYYPDVEYALPRPVDWLFERAAGLERHAIELGIRFPAGGSRVVVGATERDDRDCSLSARQIMQLVLDERELVHDAARQRAQNRHCACAKSRARPRRRRRADGYFRRLDIRLGACR